MPEIKFVKMSGAYNDFVVIDNRKKGLNALTRLARRLCDRSTAVGADGLLVIEKSNKADIRMRIYNPDGSQAEMCGNGVRCAAAYAARHVIRKNLIRVETLAGVIECRIDGCQVMAKMINPFDQKWNLNIKRKHSKGPVFFLNTGVPHAVVFVDSFDGLDIDRAGAELRFHPYFKPKGTNANFVKINSKHSISVRTYERGVETQTKACGTGSTASALASSYAGGVQSPVLVTTWSGQILKIYFKTTKHGFEEVYMQGPVQVSFEGRIGI